MHDKTMKWVEGKLFVNSDKGFIPYANSSFAQPDYQIPGGSPGYATMQFLLKQGWTIIRNEENQ